LSESLSTENPESQGAKNNLAISGKNKNGRSDELITALGKWARTPKGGRENERDHSSLPRVSAGRGPEAVLEGRSIPLERRCFDGELAGARTLPAARLE
jgi:hypothetical protein